MAAVALLELHPKLLTPADLPLIERLLRESLTWALVDGLAANVVGGILAAAPDEVDARPGPMGLRPRLLDPPQLAAGRAAAAARRAPTSLPFLRRADAMLDEKEFFIRKAIGWVLREVGKQRPAEVVGVARAEDASGQWRDHARGRALPAGGGRRAADGRLPGEAALRLITPIVLSTLHRTFPIVRGTCCGGIPRRRLAGAGGRCCSRSCSASS